MIRQFAILTIFALLSANAACAGGMVQYLRQVDGKNRATQGDMVMVIGMFLGQKDSNYSQTTEFLKERGVIDDKYPIAPTQELKRGVAAYHFARALGWKGGWLARVVGFDRRIAYKEMVSKGYMRPYGAHSPMTGSDLLGVMRILTSNRRRGQL